MTNSGSLAIGWTMATVIAGPFIGSFLGVVIDRLPRGEPMLGGRSRCDSCGATLGVRDLVPLASFALLGGRCRRCRAPIPRRLPAVELAALAVAAGAAATSAGPSVPIDAALGWALLALAWIDLETFRLPDALTLPLLLAGLAVAARDGIATVEAHAAAAALCYLLLRGVGALFRKLRGVEGLGAGDAKLLAAGGAWLGPAAIPFVLVAAALIGIAWFGALALAGRRVTRDTAIPFGPALAASIWLARLAGL